MVLVHLRVYISVSVLAGKQGTSRAAGNQSWGFLGSEERRRIREHIAIAVADQRWRQLTKELETRVIGSPPSGHCCYSVQCIATYNFTFHPTDCSSDPRPSTWCIYSMIVLQLHPGVVIQRQAVCTLFLFCFLKFSRSIVFLDFASMHEPAVPARF